MQHNSRNNSRSLPSALGLLAAALLLAACNRPADNAVADTAPSTSPAAVAAQSPDPHAAIIPEPTSSPDTIPGTGPAEGGTAIGGVVAGQDAGKPRDSGASEPTGGDGATNQPATPPAK